MEIWKKHIIQGNQLFEQSDFQASITHYKLATERARMLLPHWFTSDEVIAALLASYHNLGDTHIKMGHENKGQNCYQEAHKILEDALGEAVEGSEAYESILRALRGSHMNLMALSKQLEESQTYVNRAIDRTVNSTTNSTTIG